MTSNLTRVNFNQEYTHTIDGKRATSVNFRDVINPANKQVIASVPIATSEQLDQTIAAAAKAFPAWAKAPLAERQDAVRRLGCLVTQFKEEFMELLTREQGKPIKTHSTFEMGGVEFWFADLATQSLPDEVLDLGDKVWTTRRVPLGVCAAIVPWNFPMLLMSWKVAPALIAGNVIIVKPSPFTPLCTLKFVELAQQILPPGVLSVLSGDDGLGPLITAHPGIAKVSFTGSTATGKLVLASTAKTIKRVTLELGGKDPAVIFPDIDLKECIPKLVKTTFENNGQFCAVAKRLYIHDDIYDTFCEQFVAFARTIKIGDGMDPTSDLGPIQNAMQFAKVKKHIEDCKSSGFKFLLGGEVDEDGLGYFVPVTIVDNPPDDSRIAVEEPFGPIVPLFKWKTEEEVIRRANNSEYGLCASVWSKDVAKATRVAQQLEVGTVWINDSLHWHPRVAFGGHKMSGLGVENGAAGLNSWTNAQAILAPK